MRVAIFCKRCDDGFSAVAETLKRSFAKNRIEVVGADEHPDALAVIGGDGTVLEAAKLAVDISAPIFAINAGTVGFLASVELGEVDNAAAKLKNGDYFVSERTALKIKCKGKEYFALNDCVVERGKAETTQSVIGKIRLSIGGDTVYDLRADGIIVATPTGSTAYSLSSGGVILTPELGAFIATPVCSHALSTRPIVYPNSSVAKIEVLKNSSPCVLCVDGRAKEICVCGDEIIVSKHEKTLKIIDFKRNFFETIKTKLGE